MPGPDLLVVAPETFWRCLWTGAVAQISRDLVPCTPTSQHPLPGPRHYGPAQSPSYTNEPGSGSSSFSFRRGKAGRRDSGYFRNTLYMISTAFFRMYGLVCDICRSRCQSVPLDAMPCAPVCSPATPSQLTCILTFTPALLSSYNAHISPPFPGRKPFLQLPTFKPHQPRDHSAVSLAEPKPASLHPRPYAWPPRADSPPWLPGAQ